MRHFFSMIWFEGLWSHCDEDSMARGTSGRSRCGVPWHSRPDRYFRPDCMMRKRFMPCLFNTNLERFLKESIFARRLNDSANLELVSASASLSYDPLVHGKLILYTSMTWLGAKDFVEIWCISGQKNTLLPSCPFMIVALRSFVCQ